MGDSENDFTGINETSLEAVLHSHKLAIQQLQQVLGNTGRSSNYYNEYGNPRPVFGPVEPSKYLKHALKVTATNLPQSQSTASQSASPVATPPQSRSSSASRPRLTSVSGAPVSIGHVGMMGQGRRTRHLRSYKRSKRTLSKRRGKKGSRKIRRKTRVRR